MPAGCLRTLGPASHDHYAIASRFQLEFHQFRNVWVIVSDQQLQFPDLTQRQINAISYVRANGKITNKEYQRMNRTTRDVAKYELASLVEKKRLKKVGKTKDCCYVSV